MVESNYKTSYLMRNNKLYYWAILHHMYRYKYQSDLLIINFIYSPMTREQLKKGKRFV